MVVNPVQTFGFSIDRLIDADTSLFFTTEDNQLGVSDGTNLGTLILNSDLDGEEENFEGLNGRVLFDGFSDENGEEPFVNNGTVDSTLLLLDIESRDSETSDPLNFTAVDNIVYFTAINEVNGVALYSSDGNPDNTNFVADINPRTDTINIFGEFIDFNDSFYFVGDDGQNGREIWTSNGTEDNTQPITSFEINSLISNLTPTEEHLYFTRGSFDPDLWRTDGTGEGTQLLAENIFPDNLTSVGNRLYFSANNGSVGEELWVSDGTTEGTRLVEDIFLEDRQNGSPRNLGSNPENLTDVDGRLFFTADDGVNGRELWISDGTEEGTQLVEDLTGDETSSRFSNFIEADGKLYFIKDGDELWQSRGTAASTFQIEPEEIDLGGTTTPSFQNPERLIEFEEKLYFTGETYSPEAGAHIPALLTTEDTNTVFRLLNIDTGIHFYTTDVAERDNLLELGNHNNEGASFEAVDPTAEGVAGVYRFLNEATGTYLYTINEMERAALEDNSQFSAEGIVFDAYATQVEGTIPIYRFRNEATGTHLYTPSVQERDVVETLPNFVSEDIAYYALPSEL